MMKATAAEHRPADYPCTHCRVRGHTICAAVEHPDLPEFADLHRGHRTVQAGTDLIRQGEISKDVYVLVDGWAMLTILLEDGRRQIVEFCLPGAMFGFEPVADAPMPYSAQTITEATLCVLPERELMAFVGQRPEMAVALARTCGRHRMLDFQHLVNIGRRNARERVASLLLELFIRLRLHGANRSVAAVDLPLTQEHIGDALGLTNIHVNRVLRRLREDGIVQLRAHVLEILDPDRLAEEAGFDAEVYLPFLNDK
jgi:CRP/FNR family transcriptional regulator